MSLTQCVLYRPGMGHQLTKKTWVEGQIQKGFLRMANSMGTGQSRHMG